MVFPAATQDDSTHFLIFVLWVNMMDFCLCFQVNGGIKSEVEVLSANQHNLRSYISPMRLSLFIPSGFHCPQPKEVCSLAAPRAASTWFTSKLKSKAQFSWVLCVCVWRAITQNQKRVPPGAMQANKFPNSQNRKKPFPNTNRFF